MKNETKEKVKWKSSSVSVGADEPKSGMVYLRRPNARENEQNWAGLGCLPSLPTVIMGVVVVVV